ncbi:MAG: hypothetical protein U1E29_02200 [Coriobacteriia bacterium]|nr:hypothetical protein [Coriobacteriia bacterium]
MNQLFEAIQRLDIEIQRRGLDSFKTKGAVGLKAGFFIGIVRESDPDDPERLSALRAAARDVIGSDVAI